MHPTAPNRAVRPSQAGEIVLLGLIAAKHLAAEESDLIGAEAGYRAIAGGIERAGRVAPPIERAVNIAVHSRGQPKPASSVDRIGNTVGVRRGRPGTVIELVDDRRTEPDEGTVEIFLHRGNARELI